ncbi:DUF1501 domain-containing protein [Bordetella petrii]|nr:DUF1501 domain-containing protein [Bordetella petrii]
MDRRHFLASSAALLGGLSSTRLLAMPATDARLLFIFMRGAYDVCNTLVPVSSDLYYDSRPTIAIPRPGSDSLGSAVPIDSDWGVHPALANALGPVFAEKQIAFVPFVGIPGVSRSHFAAQEWLELGVADAEKAELPRQGMLYRLAHTLGSVDPVAFTDSMPSIFKGPDGIDNIGLDRRPNLDGKNRALRQQLMQAYRGTALESTLREGLDLQRDVSEVFDEEQLAADRGANSAKGFARESSRIASLMRDKFNLAFTDIGGWDTHVAQGSVKGQLAGRLANLGSGLAAFAKAMGPDWQRTVVVVVSEFGRTMRENGGKGTDHGFGTAYWVLGGGVKGGQLAGEQRLLRSEKDLNQARDLPVLNDYRSVLGGIFQSIYGLSAKRLQTVCGDTSAMNLKLI